MEPRTKPTRVAFGFGLLLLALGGTSACAQKYRPPTFQQVKRIELIGAQEIDAASLKQRLATRATKHIMLGALKPVPVLGLLDDLTVEYQAFDPVHFQRDLERVRRYYRARGFYDALVRAGRVIRTADGRIRVEIAVDEGKPVLVEEVSVSLDVRDSDPELYRRLRQLAQGLRGRSSSKEPDRFDEERYDRLKNKMHTIMTQGGYAYADMKGEVVVDLSKRSAKVEMTAIAGPRCRFGAIRFEGNGEIPETQLRDLIGFTPGDIYSSEKLESAQQLLAELEVFASVAVTPLRSGPSVKPRVTAVPVLVRLRPIKLRAVRLGAGAQMGQRVDVHGVVGWEDRNLLGGLRRLNAEARPGLVFFPLQIQTMFTELPRHVLPEVSLQSRFTQPGLIETYTKLHLQTGLRIFAPETTTAVDAENVVGYREVHGSVGATRKFRTKVGGNSIVHGAQAFRVRFDDPFSYNLAAPPAGFESVLVPYFETDIVWDLRHGEEGRLDSVAPRRGVYAGMNVQVAIPPGDARDVRLLPELRAYAPLGRSLVFATRFAMGFLFPQNYGESVSTVGDPDGSQRARDLQLLSFRAFFSGGPESNRGYASHEVGPHAVLGFLSQAGQNDNWGPTGGMSLWELSAELRARFNDRLGAVVFVDASDVTRTIAELRLTHPHISPGVGLRVNTPVGPLRIDLGCRVPYLQQLGQAYLDPQEGGPTAAERDDLPVSVNVAIGEAY